MVLVGKRKKQDLKKEFKFKEETSMDTIQTGTISFP